MLVEKHVMPTIIYTGSMEYDVVDHWDKNGKPITWKKWINHYSDMTYRLVRVTQIVSSADPLQSFIVSTIWSGHDMSPIFPDVPLIFETMVWDLLCNPYHQFTLRYARVGHAIEGHQRIVNMVAKPLNEPLIADLRHEDSPK